VDLVTWFYVGLLASVALGYYLLWLFDRKYPWAVEL
jgi:hypothetical protein